VEQHFRLYTSFLLYFKRYLGLLRKHSMLSLKKDLSNFTVKIAMVNGRSVLEIIYALITFQKINIDLMKEMRNILTIGFSNLTSFYAHRNGRLDWLDQCISLESLHLFLSFLILLISLEGNTLSLLAILFSFPHVLGFFSLVC
jgi:hypothetical protein